MTTDAVITLGTVAELRIERWVNSRQVSSPREQTTRNYHEPDSGNRIWIGGHVVIIYNKGMKMYLLLKKRGRRRYQTVSEGRYLYLYLVIYLFIFITYEDVEHQ